MRALASEPYRFTLLEDEASGTLWLDAECNVSAAYFTVRVALLPDEVLEVRASKDAGHALAGKLADEAQRAPEKFREQRTREWQARGLAEPGTGNLR